MDIQSLPWYAQLLVFLVVGGILFGIFYMLHYSDNQVTIERLDKQIDGVEREIKRAEQKEAQLPRIKEDHYSLHPVGYAGHKRVNNRKYNKQGQYKV